MFIFCNNDSELKVLVYSLLNQCTGKIDLKFKNTLI